jgi:hypothetical protein
MSFSFQWPRFSDQFHADAIEMLNAALNKGPKPPVIADKIEVVELEMGTQVRLFPHRIPNFLPGSLINFPFLVSRASPPSSKFATLAISPWSNFAESFVSHIMVMHILS